MQVSCMDSIVLCMKLQSSLTPAAGGMSAAWHRWRQTKEQLGALRAIPPRRPSGIRAAVAGVGGGLRGCASGFVVRMQCEIPLSGDISPNSESCLNNSDQNKQNQLPGGWKIRIIREDLFSGDGFLLRREGWRIF